MIDHRNGLPAPARDLEGTRAVILAGGRGARLAPYTSVLPKPLMPIGEKAILEVVVEQLAAAGIVEVTFCVGYLSHLIRAVFDNGRDRGAHIAYVQEENALGTAAPLRLVEGLDKTFIAMNGDVLTALDFQDLLGHHEHSGNALTIATHQRTIRIDYGVMQLAGQNGYQVVAQYEEKPELTTAVSMGIYVVDPSVLEYIPDGEHFDFPELVQALLEGGEQVGAYVYEGLWFDIGRHEDYEKAVAVWESSIARPDPNLVGEG
jgi:NDP-mannose synthase